MERWLFIDGAAAFGGHEVMLTQWIDELAARGVRPRCWPGREPCCARRPPCHGRGAAGRPTVGGARGLGCGRRWRDARLIWRTIRDEAAALCVVAEGSPLSQTGPALVCRLAGVRVAIYLPLTQPTSEMGFRAVGCATG